MLYCRFHAYGVVMEMESFDPLPLNDDSNRAHVAVRRRTIGGKYDAASNHSWLY